MFSSADASSGRSMLHRLGLLIRRLLEYKPVRFVLVGGLNTVFGYGVFATVYLLTHHRLGALVTATVLGVTFNYFTTGRLVFASKGGGARAIVPFVLLYGVLLLVNAPLLEGLVRIGLPTLVAQALVIPFMAALSYLINRYWVFRPREGEAAASGPTPGSRDE
jgi:putative flippase GtrA